MKLTEFDIATREQALDEIVEEHRGRLLSVIRKLVRDQVEAEDVLQDVFEEYVETYDVGEVIESIGAWLVTVAKNKILDRFRRQKTRDDYQNLILDTNEASASNDPEDELTHLTMREELVTGIELLPEDQREVFIKHELEGKSFEEIAKETGVGINTLLSRKRYAILFLRNHLKEIYDELE